MPFVRPNYLVWTATNILQKVGFLIAMAAEIHFVLFFIPFIDLKIIPTVDNNPYENMANRTKAHDTFAYKLGFNLFLMSLFFVQHWIMARLTFKNFMNAITAN